jgi:hypothetical protein
MIHVLFSKCIKISKPFPLKPKKRERRLSGKSAGSPKAKATVRQFVAMVAGARKHGQEAGVGRAWVGLRVSGSPSTEGKHVQAVALRGKPLQQTAL